MKADALETPAVLIDLDRLEANIQRMQAVCFEQGLALRAHVAAHKIPEIARMQIDAGAVGIACASVSEAEVFAQEGFTNIQVPYNVVGPAKTARLADLALFNHLTTSADHPLVIAGLADAARANEITIRVLIELSTSLERGGAAPGEVVALAERIDADENLHFAGLLVYPSTVDALPVLAAALTALHNAGLGVDIVSGGGTAALRKTKEIAELTEICAGTYVYYDWGSVIRHQADMDQCAMTVLATVVSRPNAERVILDCGSRILGLNTAEGGHGFVLEYPDAFIYRLSEGHAHVDMSKCRDLPVIGERVRVIPVRASAVSSLASYVYGIRGDTVQVEWLVAARGLLW